MSILATWTGHHYLQKLRSCYPPLIRRRRKGNITQKRVCTGAYIASFTEQLRALISIYEFFQQSPPLARLSISPLICCHIALSEVLEIELVFSVVLIFHARSSVIYDFNTTAKKMREKQQENVMNPTRFCPELHPDHYEEPSCI